MGVEPNNIFNLRLLHILIFFSSGFRDRDDLNSEVTKNSLEPSSPQHSRTHSEGGSGPPNGNYTSYLLV